MVLEYNRPRFWRIAARYLFSRLSGSPDRRVSDCQRFYVCSLIMQGLFYSVTATFTTLIIAIFLFVAEHVDQSSTSHFQKAHQTRAHAVELLESLRSDIQHIVLPEPGSELHSTCQVSLNRNGRTREFTFPTLRSVHPDEAPRVVQVTYVLEGLARQVSTRNGDRDLYRLRRILDDETPRQLPSEGNTQIVDFLIELIPASSTDAPYPRIVSGACPTDLDRVYVEFHVAVQEAANYIVISSYSTTIQREFLQHLPPGTG